MFQQFRRAVVRGARGAEGLEGAEAGVAVGGADDVCWRDEGPRAAGAVEVAERETDLGREVARGRGRERCGAEQGREGRARHGVGDEVEAVCGAEAVPHVRQEGVRQVLQHEQPRPVPLHPRTCIGCGCCCVVVADAVTAHAVRAAYAACAADAVSAEVVDATIAVTTCASVTTAATATVAATQFDCSHCAELARAAGAHEGEALARAEAAHEAHEIKVAGRDRAAQGGRAQGREGRVERLDPRVARGGGRGVHHVRAARRLDLERVPHAAVRDAPDVPAAREADAPGRLLVALPPVVPQHARRQHKVPPPPALPPAPLLRQPAPQTLPVRAARRHVSTLWVCHSRRPLGFGRQ